jgi:uncharacterized protein YjbI with pentapeptide repeats
MSDEQQQQQSKIQVGLAEKTRGHWGEPIGDERRGELLAWLQGERSDFRSGPFTGKRLSGADVFFLAAHTLVGTRDDCPDLLAAQALLLHGRDDPNPDPERYANGEYFNPAFDISLWDLDLREAGLRSAHLEGAILTRARLNEANLMDAHLEGAILHDAYLKGASLAFAHLEGADLSDAHLDGALLYRAHLDGDTDLDRASLGPGLLADWLDRLRFRNRNALLADVKWGGADLTTVPWGRLRRLGDTLRARGWFREFAEVMWVLAC